MSETEALNVVVRGNVRQIVKSATGGYKLVIDVFDTEKEAADKVFADFQGQNAFVTLVAMGDM